jgi:hypothetical protein
MFKKIMVLGAAIAALVAIAAPAANAEVKWTTDGTAIATHDIVTFSGAANFELTNKTAGAHASVVATMTLNPGTLKAGTQVGTVTEFHVSNCTGTGALNGLPCTPTTTTQNWPVTLNANKTLTIDVNLVQHYYGNAQHTGPILSTTTLTGPVIVDLNTPAEVKTGTLTAGAGLLANGSPATFSGTLTKAGANKLTLD